MRNVVSVRLNTDELDAQCARLKVSRTQMIRKALEAYLSPAVTTMFLPNTTSTATTSNYMTGSWTTNVGNTDIITGAWSPPDNSSAR